MSIKKTSLNFDFDMTYDCPHCGKENNCEPDDDHEYDPIFQKFLDWVGNKTGGGEVDIQTMCEHCEKGVHLSEIIR